MMTSPATITLSPAFTLGNKTVPASTTSTGSQTPIHSQKGHTLQVEIPKEPLFDLPQGRFGATISNLRPFIKQAGNGPQEWIRFIFQVEIPGLSQRFNTMAARSFKLDLRSGSELRNWLTELLGRQFFTDRSGQQIDLDFVVETECEVELEHRQGKGYEKPLVVPARLFPVVSKGADIKWVKEVED